MGALGEGSGWDLRVRPAATAAAPEIWEPGNVGIWEFGDPGTWKSRNLEIWGPGHPEMWGTKNQQN